MGLFEKKKCVRCGKELGLIFGKIKIADGHICKDCNALLSPLLTGKSSLSLQDIEEHLKYREQNKASLKNFKATTILGNSDKVYFDDNHKTFIVHDSGNYIEKNIDVISLDDVSSCELNIEEEQEEIFQTDKDGNEVSYNPERYITSYTYKIELTLTNRWIKEITIDVSNGEIEESKKEELLKIDNLANEIVAKFKGTTFTPKTDIGDEDDEEHWQCAKCGQINDISSKFCTNCGEARTSKQKFCGECGTKLPLGTKFCPNCGTPVN